MATTLERPISPPLPPPPLSSPEPCTAKFALTVEICPRAECDALALRVGDIVTQRICVRNRSFREGDPPPRFTQPTSPHCNPPPSTYPPLNTASSPPAPPIPLQDFSSKTTTGVTGVLPAGTRFELFLSSRVGMAGVAGGALPGVFGVVGFAADTRARSQLTLGAGGER